MAKVFDGWKSDKDVLKSFGDSSSKGYEILFAFLDKKNYLEPFIVLMSKGSKFYYAIGNLTEYQENKQSLFDLLDTITKKEFISLFSSEKWYKKHKVEIDMTFDNLKESKFMVFLKESEETYAKENPISLYLATFEITKEWKFPEYNVDYQPGDIIKVYKIYKDKQLIVGKPNKKIFNGKPSEVDEMSIKEIFEYAKLTDDSIKRIKELKQKNQEALDNLKTKSEEMFKQLENAINAHDKTYQYSDNYKEWKKGSDEIAYIQNLAINLKKIDPSRVERLMKKLKFNE